jgi:hypothetical protein
MAAAAAVEEFLQPLDDVTDADVSETVILAPPCVVVTHQLPQQATPMHGGSAGPRNCPILASRAPSAGRCTSG